MKKNLIYLCILTVLLTLTYFSEEILKPKAKMKRDLQRKVISQVEDISRIKVQHLEFSKTQSGEWTTSHPYLMLDEIKFESFFSVLKGLAISSEITDKKIEEFTKFQSIPFTIFKGEDEYNYILGDVSEATGAFYLIDAKKNIVYVCYDESLLKDIYRNQTQLDLKKYIRFKNMLSNLVESFHDTGILQFLLNDEILSIEIHNLPNRKFSLDFESNRMSPLPPKSIEYYPLSDAFISLISRSSIEAVIPLGRNIVSHLISDIKIKGKQNNYDLKLYSSLNGEFGRYLKINNKKELYKLRLEKPNLFFSNMQDFWDKRQKIAKASLAGLKKLEFKMSNAGEYFDFYVDDFESFSVKFDDKRVLAVSQTHINMLFNLLFNLVDFKSARYIQVGEGDDKKYMLSIKLLGEEYKLGFSKYHIEVYETSTSISYFYDYNTRLIGKQFFANIFTVK